MDALRGFANEYHSRLQGLYLPGSTIEVHHASANTDTLLTHERCHEFLTENSSAGQVAYLCGIVAYFTDDMSRRKSMGSYIRHYCNRSAWIQEGAATALEMWHSIALSTEHDDEDPLESFLLTRPASYIEASDELMGRAFLLKESMTAIDDQTSLSILMETINSVAIAAMSPPISESTILNALTGNGHYPELSGIWKRYKSLLRCDIELVADRLSERLNDVPTDKLQAVLHIRDAIIRSFTEAASIEYEAPAGVQTLIQKFAPEYLNRVTVRHPELGDDLQSLVETLYPTVIKPAKMNLRYDGGTELIERWRSGKQIVVAELGGFPSGEAMLLLHCFEPDGAYLFTYISRRNLTEMRRTLIAMKAWLAPKESSRISGFVCSPETHDEHLPGLLTELPSVFTPLFRTEDQGPYEEIGSFERARLVQTKTSRGVRWNVLPGDSSSPLSPDEKAYLWVLKNGTTALLRWENIQEARGHE